MPTYEYYELRGLEPQGEMPSGLFRVVTTDDGLYYERVTIDGEWVEDNAMVRYFAGYADEAILITKAEADKFLDYLKSGQARRDKAKEAWK